MKALLKVCLTTALVSLMGSAFAQASPVGLWKTIDDDTNQEKSFVRIVEVSGTLSGKIEKILDATKQDSTCEKCTDGRKNQKVLGMTIIENVKKAAGEEHWDSGTILDPNNGKTYKVRLTPKDGGKVLEVRGFIGPFYRNQKWLRLE